MSSKRSVVLVALTVAIIAPVSAQSQVRLAVSPGLSLAWWQIQPHMGHLWATTCPADTSWFAGAAHSAGYRYDIKRDPMKGRLANTHSMEMAAVPLYPRFAVAPVCEPAVRGEIQASDTTNWKTVRGLISVRAEALTTGQNMRDDFARKRILNTDAYPDIRFFIDSVTDVQKGDTIAATALGQLELHGVKQPFSVPIKAWKQPQGMRVTGHFAIPAEDLVDVYKFSRFPLGLGVGTKIWHSIHMGFDVILVRPS